MNISTCISHGIVNYAGTVIKTSSFGSRAVAIYAVGAARPARCATSDVATISFCSGAWFAPACEHAGNMSLALLFALSLLGVNLGSCNGVNELLPLGTRERIESASCVDLLIILVIHVAIDKGVGPILTLSSLNTERLQAPLGINFAVDTDDPALIKDKAWLRSGDVTYE